MGQRLYQYRPAGSPPEDERRVYQWHPMEGAPAAVTVEGVEWELVAARPRDTTQKFKCIREGIRSIQLPKHWPFAKRHDATGACIFENETEAKEAVRRARDAGEPVSWDN